jgi:hypothetical protein
VMLVVCEAQKTEFTGPSYRIHGVKQSVELS